MKKILSFSYDADIATECWTFYKMAIVKNHKSYRNWLFNRFNLYLNDKCNCLYGDGGVVYKKEYYEPLLTTKEVDEGGLKTPEDYLNQIIKGIENDHYMFINVDAHVLLKEESINYIHDTAFYGYDLERKILYTPQMNSGKTFEARTVSFDDFMLALESAQRFYATLPNDSYFVNESYYTFTAMELNQDATVEKNLFTFYYSVLDQYLSGSCKQTYYDVETKSKVTRQFWESSAIFSRMAQRLDEIAGTEESFSDWVMLSVALKKAYEYKKIFAMKLHMIREDRIQVPQRIFEHLDQACQNIKTAILLALKFEASRNDALIEELKTILQDLFYLDVDILYETEAFLKIYLATNRPD